MFQIGDLVTRKSYNNDIVFKIVEINDDNFILKGVTVRLCADSPKEDLVIYDNDDDDDFLPEIDGYRNLERNEYFYLPGRILHIDGDKEYLDRCMKFYKKNRLKAFGIYSLEENLPEVVQNSLDKYNPDIVVYENVERVSYFVGDSYKVIAKGT